MYMFIVLWLWYCYILLLLLSFLLLFLPIIFWTPIFCVLIYSVSEISTQSTKKGRFKDWHSCSHERWRCEPLAPPWKILSYVPLRHFETTNEHKPWRKVEAVQCITTSKIIAGSCSDPAKGKNSLETPEKRQRIKMLQRLVKQRSFKNRENIKWKWEAGNVSRKWEASGQKRRVGISGVFSLPRTVWVSFK